MPGRRALTSVLLIAGALLAGCAGDDQRPGQQQLHATVTVGDTTVDTLPVCTGEQWSWLIDGSQGDHSVNAAVARSEQGAVAQWVKVRDIGGFTGSYWNNGVGKATATANGTTFTIRGELYGVNAQQPNVPATEPFHLVAQC